MRLRLPVGALMRMVPNTGSVETLGVLTGVSMVGSESLWVRTTTLLKRIALSVFLLLIFK